MLRAVIFDYGNTLVGLDPKKRSTRTDYADVVALPGAQRLAAHLVARGILPASAAGDGFVRRFLEIRERNRLTADQTGREITAATSLAEAIADTGATVPPAAAVAESIRVLFAFEESSLVTLPGARETVAYLARRGVKLGLLSNATDGKSIERTCERFGLRGAFDPFVVSADIGVRKPRAEAFRAVLERWSYAPHSVAMVGDSLVHDVDGANRLGLYSIHFTLIPNAIDPPHRGSIVPRAEIASHKDLRAHLTPLLAAAPE